MRKYIIHKGNYAKERLEPALQARGNWSEASENDAKLLKAHFIWTPTLLPSSVILTQAYLNQDRLGHTIIYNHLENIRKITTKPGLVRSLRDYYRSVPNYSVSDSMPTSFIVKAGVKDPEFLQFLAQYKSRSPTEMPSKHCRENMWLVKPSGLNQGRGIEVCRTLDEVTKVLRSKSSTWLVQKYIQRPLLFKGRKMDIRIWALMTAHNDLLYYRKGYVRTSSSEYDTKGKDNYIHLTNNCLQKHGEAYGLYEPGNTLSFEDFQEYLTEEWGLVDVWEHLIPRMKDLMIDVHVSFLKDMGERKMAFELVGFDFLIDEDFRVWLIEANTNPYLGIPNEYIEGVLPAMVDELLELTVDVHFGGQRSQHGFEVLYSQGGTLISPEAVNQRRDFGLIGPFDGNQASVVGSLKQWETMSRTELQGCVAALRMGDAEIGDGLLELVVAAPDYLKWWIIDAVFQGSTATKIQAVRSGFVQFLVERILEGHRLRGKCLAALQSCVLDQEVPRELIFDAFLCLMVVQKDDRKVAGSLKGLISKSDCRLVLEYLRGGQLGPTGGLFEPEALSGLTENLGRRFEEKPVVKKAKRIISERKQPAPPIKRLITMISAEKAVSQLKQAKEGKTKTATSAPSTKVPPKQPSEAKLTLRTPKIKHTSDVPVQLRTPPENKLEKSRTSRDFQSAKRSSFACMNSSLVKQRILSAAFQTLPALQSFDKTF